MHLCSFANVVSSYFYFLAALLELLFEKLPVDKHIRKFCGASMLIRFFGLQLLQLYVENLLVRQGQILHIFAQLESAFEFLAIELRLPQCQSIKAESIERLFVFLGFSFQSFAILGGMAPANAEDGHQQPIEEPYEDHFHLFNRCGLKRQARCQDSAPASCQRAHIKMVTPFGILDSHERVERLVAAPAAPLSHCFLAAIATIAPQIACIRLGKALAAQAKQFEELSHDQKL